MANSVFLMYVSGMASRNSWGPGVQELKAIPKGLIGQFRALGQKRDLVKYKPNIVYRPELGIDVSEGQYRSLGSTCI